MPPIIKALIVYHVVPANAMLKSSANGYPCLIAEHNIPTRHTGKTGKQEVFCMSRRKRGEFEKKAAIP